MSYNLLKGKRGIIFGALNEQSIAWKVAEKAVEEGATITLSNTPVAVRMRGDSCRCYKCRRFGKCIQTLYGSIGWPGRLCAALHWYVSQCA